MDDWNHNAAYYAWIKAETASCRSILDVGCGDGALISFLDDGTKELLGIDPEKSCIDQANRLHRTDHAAFLCRSFEALDTEQRFDAVTFVASLHHMDMKPALEKAIRLLRDDGVLLIVGLAKPSNAMDHLVEGLRVIPCSVISRMKHMRAAEAKNIPVSYDFPHMSEVRNAADTLLPGCSIKYGLFYRFLLKWRKKEN